MSSKEQPWRGSGNAEGLVLRAGHRKISLLNWYYQAVLGFNTAMKPGQDKRLAINGKALKTLAAAPVEDVNGKLARKRKGQAQEKSGKKRTADKVNCKDLVASALASPENLNVVVDLLELHDGAATVEEKREAMEGAVISPRAHAEGLLQVFQHYKPFVKPSTSAQEGGAIECVRC